MIKVMIERRVATDLATQYRKISGRALQTAMQSDGFISGESLRDAKDPNHRFVFATYRSLMDWQKWDHSEERRQQMDQLRPLLMDEEKITILEHL